MGQRKGEHIIETWETKRCCCVKAGACHAHVKAKRGLQKLDEIFMYSMNRGLYHCWFCSRLCVSDVVLRETHTEGHY